MATIILQAAGAALGSVFGPVGAIVGRAAGALAGSAIDRSLFGQGGGTVERGRLSAARIPGADEGSPLARVYGTARVAGTLIWATRFEEQVTVERAGGKGGGGTRVETFTYYANFALGLCEGPIAGIRRVWADGRELDLTEIEMRLHRGTEDQPVDPLLAAKQGTEALPAYRGLATLVFERFPLDRFGNRIPVIHAEVLRPVGRLERDIRAVTIIPGATEHGYDPAVVSETTGDGASRLINRNIFHAGSDWEASIDELQALCPNLERVALVVAWFGTDLRAGTCRIRPGVEVRARRDESREWRVAGLDRTAAHLVSGGADGPAYGGTPSDASVLAAIADLTARGLKVYLYPFLMMDVPPGNGLPDPYGGAEQAAYPWRGRLTCHPAPGRPGTADGTAAGRSTVEAFLGTIAYDDFDVSGGLPVAPASDEGYRRFVLHHAKLAALAGGVDGFIIGSEMRGLTRVRDEAGAFPFVEGLVALASDVRAALGPATKLTYAADWSEYAGLDLGGGAFRYHLDALWAAPEIDAVGIDAYLPLADWRDGDIGSGNPDGFAHAEDEDAMRAMARGGEGYDWFYASPQDRAARQRTPITDGMAGKPWVYRVKDIASWWGNRHYDRTSTGESAVPTAWLPGMKPVWFTELGCPAIDHGANQPNVFVDPKSAESALPYFSRGRRSDAMQRRYLEAMLSSWADAGGPVDPDHMFVWTWDARPVPAFPLNRALFADGTNWATGHWLNGRLGAGTLRDVVSAVLADHGVTDADITGLCGDLDGIVQDGPASARSLIEPLMALYGIAAGDHGGRLTLCVPARLAAPARRIDVLAEPEEGGRIEETIGHASDFATGAVLDLYDASRDYERRTLRSRRLGPAGERTLSLSLPGTLHETAAEAAMETALADQQLARRRLTFHLSPSEIAVEPGDRLRLADGPAGLWLVERIEDGAMRRIEARAFAAGPALSASSGETAAATPRREASDGYQPVVVLMDLPMMGNAAPESFASAAVLARPWRSTVLSSSATGEGYRLRCRIDRPARLGRLVEALGAGVCGRFDRRQALVVDLSFGGLSSVSPGDVLNGANRAVLVAGDGRLEVIAFTAAEEIAAGRFRLTGLLRGLFGTDDAMSAGFAAGDRFLMLDEAVTSLALAADEAGRSLNWIAEAAGRALPPVGPQVFAGGLRAVTPLAPVHLRARRQDDGSVVFGWLRRGRIEADTWFDGDVPLDEPEERYRIEVLAGADVLRRAETTTDRWTYAASEEIADFGAPQETIAIRVRQIGARMANGLPATARLAP